MQVVVDVSTVPRGRYMGILNEVLLLVDEDAEAGVPPMARALLAIALCEGPVRVFSVCVREIPLTGERDPAEWPGIRPAVASYALTRLAQLVQCGGFGFPAVVVGDLQPIRVETAAMLTGVPGFSRVNPGEEE